MAPPRRRAHRSASSARAMLSAPPETATAKRGARSNGPSRSSLAANCSSLSGVASLSPSAYGMSAASGRATQPLLLGARAVADLTGGLRIVAVEALIGAAGVVLLTEIGERHPELQQEVRPLRTLRILLVAVGERRGGVRIVLTNVEGLAEPILRGGRERVPGMLLHESAERLLGILVAGLPQQAEGSVVLILRIGRARRRRGVRAWRRGLRRARSQDRVGAGGTADLLAFGHADHAER